MRFKNVSIYKPRGRNKRHHPYLIAVTVEGEPRRVITASTDYDDTRDLAAHLSRLAQRIENKQSDRVELRQEIERRKPLTHHLNAYEASLVALAMTKKHALQMRLYAEEALEGFATVDDIVASEVQDKVWKMDLSAVTKNRRLYAVTNFLAWGAEDNRWPQSVIERIKLKRLPQTKTRPRRVLSVDELVKLIQTAESGEIVAGVTGKQRALMYRTLVSTGLRLGELTRLCTKHIADQGFDIPGNLTKNRKPAMITLPANLMIEVQQFVAGKSGDDRIFPVSKFNPDRLLKHDLAAAGIAHKTPRGVFDFHSLRHQCATLLAASGAQANVVKSHMRHSSIKLTLDTYGHLFDGDRIRAAELMGKIVQRRAQRAGGNMYEQTPIPKWSDGESNPDLLNAIQRSEDLILIRQAELQNKRGRALAPGVAPRLLRMLMTRAYRRSLNRANRA